VLDYKTGAQAKALVFHHQFAQALRFAYSIASFKYYPRMFLSTGARRGHFA